jgi:predicted acyltransferase
MQEGGKGMRSAEQNLDPGLEGRLESLDVFRGFTMFLLVAEATGLYELLVDPAFGGTVVRAIGAQFQHHPWNGLRFWDLIQPFFMFIVGVAMPFSYGKRWGEGATWAATFRHALKRSFLLLLFGWALYCIGPGRLTFELWNVLAQLSFTCLVAFLMMRRSAPAQIAFSIGLLALTEILYRTWAVPGFNQPFVADHNFGSWVDMALMGKLSEGHWVAFNAVPTAAHTMWGVLAGLLLRSRRPPARKVGILAAAGLALAVAGYALDPVTPIVKRIATSTFVLASGGWCLLALAFTYGLIDVMKLRRGWKFLAVVGMNPLFIYLFTETGGAEWFRRIARPFTEGVFGGPGEPAAAFATALAVWAMLWGLCCALYRKRIFVRI